MKEVTILGMWGLDPKLKGKDKREDFNGDLWVILDWQRRYPFLDKVEKCFELHGYAYHYAMQDDNPQGYFSGNWEEEYRNDCKELIVWDREWSKIRKDLTLIDYEHLRKEYGEKTLSSTGSTMLCQAIEDGYESIELYGFSYNLPYHAEAYGMMQAINIAEKRGIKVYDSSRERWERITSKPHVRKPDSYIAINIELNSLVKAGASKEAILAHNDRYEKL